MIKIAVFLFLGILQTSDSFATPGDLSNARAADQGMHLLRGLANPTKMSNRGRLAYWTHLLQIEVTKDGNDFVMKFTQSFEPAPPAELRLEFESGKFTYRIFPLTRDGEVLSVYRSSPNPDQRPSLIENSIHFVINKFAEGHTEFAPYYSDLKSAKLLPAGISPGAKHPYQVILAAEGTPKRLNIFLSNDRIPVGHAFE